MPVVGTWVNGHSDVVTNMSRDTPALPVDHVPNKVYLVGHGSALHRIVHSKVNHLIEHTVVSSELAKDNKDKSVTHSVERWYTGAKASLLDANDL